MKIIAKTDDGLLVEATERDLAQILGFESTYTKGFDKSKLKIGTEISIGKITVTASAVRTMSTDRLEQIKTNLKNAIDRVEEAQDNVNQLNLFDMLKDEHDDT